MSKYQIVIIALVIVQRLSELMTSKRHERILKSRGGYEVGREHYSFIVVLHVLYFISLITEIYFWHRLVSSAWPFLLILLILAQSLRFWSIRSLGDRWTTRIIIVPNEPPIHDGPYQYLRHPSYIAVAVEVPALALFCGAIYTAFVFSILNAIMLSVRIAKENEVLLSK